MIRKLITAAIVLAVLAVAAFWFLSAPRTLAAGALPDHKPDLANGACFNDNQGNEVCGAFGHTINGVAGDAPVADKSHHKVS